MGLLAYLLFQVAKTFKLPKQINNFENYTFNFKIEKGWKM